MASQQLLVMPAGDGTWSWIYRDDGTELRSASTFPNAAEAQQAARAAYPAVPVREIGSSGLGEAGEIGGSGVSALRGLSVLALVRRLLRDVSALVRDEGNLARAEMRETARRTTFAGALIGTAIFLGLLAAGAMTAFLILALALVMQAWLAALIVGIAYAIGGGVFGLLGVRSAKRASPPIPRTTQTVKETLAWAKDQMRSEKR